MAAHLTVNGTGLLADPAGALLVQEARTLVVADLHLEKGSSFARRGVLLPPYDTRMTLERLARVLRHYRPARVLCLGDSFHDGEGPSRLASADADALRRLVQAHEWVWIAGNHDPAPPPSLGGRVEAEMKIGPLTFRHQPEGTIYAPGEVCGHFHPKAAISTAARRVSGPCFATDGRRLVMPAFGAYTGGLDVLDPAIAGLFGRAGFRVLMLGRERLHAFPHTRLDGFGAPRRPALTG
jgi:hypothetical protein